MKDKFPGLLRGGPSEISPHARSQHPGERLRELYPEGTPQRHRCSSGHPDTGTGQGNGSEFNMEAGREPAEMRSAGKSPDPWFCHDIFEKFCSVR